MNDGFMTEAQANYIEEAIKNGETLIASGPVSYTHLDVYKRQEEDYLVEALVEIAGPEEDEEDA